MSHRCSYFLAVASTSEIIVSTNSHERGTGVSLIENFIFRKKNGVPSSQRRYIPRPARLFRLFSARTRVRTFRVAFAMQSSRAPPRRSLIMHSAPRRCATMESPGIHSVYDRARFSSLYFRGGIYSRLLSMTAGKKNVAKCVASTRKGRQREVLFRNESDKSNRNSLWIPFFFFFYFLYIRKPVLNFEGLEERTEDLQ